VFAGKSGSASSLGFNSRRHLSTLTQAPKVVSKTSSQTLSDVKKNQRKKTKVPEIYIDRRAKFPSDRELQRASHE
jgi:hypothetical protein